MVRLFPLLLLFFLLANTGVKGQRTDSGLVFDLSSPCMFAGTDFGRFFQRLHINQDYNLMLTFTSQKSRDKFGDEELLEYYQKINFAFPLKLKSKLTQGDTIWLNYITSIQATQRVVVMPVVVEQDTVRVLILSIQRKSFLID